MKYYQIYKKGIQMYGIRQESALNRIYVRFKAILWASYATTGNLNFNDELINMDKKLGRYVIVHELLHFHTPNHGRLWKSLMHAYLEDYEKIDKRLKLFSKD